MNPRIDLLETGHSFVGRNMLTVSAEHSIIGHSLFTSVAC